MKKTVDGISKAGTTIDRGISMLIYADPGVGKTTLASTLPVDETLIINTEAGIGALLGTKHVVFNLDQNLKQLQGLYEKIITGELYKDVCKAYEIKPKGDNFQNIVIDNISELQDWMVIVLTRGRGKEFTSIHEHGDAAQKMREYLHLFRDLTFKGIDVVFNAWEFPLVMEESEDNTSTRLYPKLYKKIAPEICGIVDLVGHLERYEKTGERFIRFEGNQKLVAKSQFKGVEKFEPANIPALFEKIRAHKYEESDGDNTV